MVAFGIVEDGKKCLHSRINIQSQLRSTWISILQPLWTSLEIQMQQEIPPATNSILIAQVAL